MNSLTAKAAEGARAMLGLAAVTFDSPMPFRRRMSFDVGCTLWGRPANNLMCAASCSSEDIQGARANIVVEGDTGLATTFGLFVSRIGCCSAPS